MTFDTRPETCQCSQLSQKCVLLDFLDIEKGHLFRTERSDSWNHLEELYVLWHYEYISSAFPNIATACTRSSMSGHHCIYSYLM